MFASFKFLHVDVLLTVYINSKIKYRSVANEVQEATVTVTEKWQTVTLKSVSREQMLRAFDAATEHYCTHRNPVLISCNA